MKIKPAVINGLFAVLFALAVTACSSDVRPDDEDTDSDDDGSVITYTADQAGGTDGTTGSTGVVFTFSASIDDLDLTAAEITVGGKAGKGSALTFTGEEKSWTLDGITVSAAGLATVKIAKDGIESEIKYITVHKEGQPTPEIMTITWNFNGGTADTDAQHPARIEEGETLAKPSNPERANDEFIGWFSNSGLTHEYDFADPVTANLNLYAKWNRAIGDPVEEGDTLAEKLAWINENVENNKAYTIEVDVNAEIDSRTLYYASRSGVAIILKGIGGERIISLSPNSSGSLFVVESGVTLVLDSNITLKGRSSGSSSLVRVNSGGVFEMETGSKITGNTTSSSYATYGGGVYVSGGTFTMNGGEISGNTADSLGGGSFGGGVYVNGGTFIKLGGTIYGSDSDPINSNAVRDSSGEEIEVVNGRGHAVYVYVNPELNMRRETTAGPGVVLDSGRGGVEGGWEEDQP